MTWAKYGTEFWDECANAELSDAAARTHAEAICWVYRVERTDLRIPKHLMRRFVGSPQWDVAVRDLVATGFWQDSGDAYVVVHHGDVIRASIAAQRLKRERDKRSQRQWRQRNIDPDVSGDVSAYADSQTDSQEEKVTKDETKGRSEVRAPGSGLRSVPDRPSPDEVWRAQAPGYDH